jgi:glycerate kinase
VRVVIAPGSFGATLGAAAAAEAIAAGWRRAAPDDDLVLSPVVGAGPAGPADLAGLAGLGEALDGAGLAVTGEGSFDWRSLRGTPVPAVAGMASARGVPCVVLAGQVLVGRREAAAVGVDAAYAVDPAAGAAGVHGRGAGAGGSDAGRAAGNGAGVEESSSDPAGAEESSADPAGALAALAEKVARRWSR